MIPLERENKLFLDPNKYPLHLRTSDSDQGDAQGFIYEFGELPYGKESSPNHDIVSSLQYLHSPLWIDLRENFESQTPESWQSCVETCVILYGNGYVDPNQDFSLPLICFFKEIIEKESEPSSHHPVSLTEILRRDARSMDSAIGLYTDPYFKRRRTLHTLGFLGKRISEEGIFLPPPLPILSIENVAQAVELNIGMQDIDSHNINRKKMYVLGTSIASLRAQWERFDQEVINVVRQRIEKMIEANETIHSTQVQVETVDGNREEKRNILEKAKYKLQKYFEKSFLVGIEYALQNGQIKSEEAKELLEKIENVKYGWLITDTLVENIVDPITGYTMEGIGLILFAQGYWWIQVYMRATPLSHMGIIRLPYTIIRSLGELSHLKQTGISDEDLRRHEEFYKKLVLMSIIRIPIPSPGAVQPFSYANLLLSESTRELMLLAVNQRIQKAAKVPSFVKNATKFILKQLPM